MGLHSNIKNGTKVQEGPQSIHTAGVLYLFFKEKLGWKTEGIVPACDCHHFYYYYFFLRKVLMTL